MTEAEVWQQIERFAIEGNWTGVGVMGDWLQEKGIAEGETVCWWAKQPEPQSWIKYAYPYYFNSVIPGCWHTDHSLFSFLGGDLKNVFRDVHNKRVLLKALLT